MTKTGSKPVTHRREKSKTIKIEINKKLRYKKSDQLYQGSLKILID